MHNFSKFDVIFLLKILVDHKVNNPIERYDLSFKYRDNTILSITIAKDGRKITIFIIMLSSILVLEN